MPEGSERQVAGPKPTEKFHHTTYNLFKQPRFVILVCHGMPCNPRQLSGVNQRVSRSSPRLTNDTGRAAGGLGCNTPYPGVVPLPLQHRAAGGLRTVQAPGAARRTPLPSAILDRPFGSIVPRRDEPATHGATPRTRQVAT